jgi:hypothetical protein
LLRRQRAFPSVFLDKYNKERFVDANIHFNYINPIDLVEYILIILYLIDNQLNNLLFLCITLPIFGETTAGAAHWVTSNSMGNGFIGNIPFRKAVNPVTHKNWEKVGVKPDVKSNDEQVLDDALIYAYDHLINTSTDSAQTRSLKWFKTVLKAQQHPVKIAANVLNAFAGNYNGRFDHTKKWKTIFY